MLANLFNWILATFVFAPVQAEIEQRVSGAQEARAAVQQAQVCFDAAGPVLVQRLQGDWLWAVSTVVKLSVGMAEPRAVLVEAAPACVPVLDLLDPPGEPA